MLRLNTLQARLMLSRVRQHTPAAAFHMESSPPPPLESLLLSRSFTSNRPSHQEPKEENKKEENKKENKREDASGSADEKDEKFQWGVSSVLAVTAAIALTRYYRTISHGESTAASPDNASVSCQVYKMLPLRLVSRIWGSLNSVVLPMWARERVYNTYGRLFGCSMDEVERPLKDYSNLGEFFTRRLKHGARPIADTDMVSPVDGRVLTFGKVTSDTVEQVKGIRYSMGYFLGEPVEPILEAGRHLYQIVLYLAPGDYHGFHSPVDWKMEKRVHFHGHMLSVSKAAAKFVPGLFGINERVVLQGTWKGGAFFYSPVAATNVGNISIHEDPEIRTNIVGKRWTAQEEVSKTYNESIGVGKGEEIGFFKLGSTIVMVFESDEDFQFLCKEGEKVRLGQPLGVVGEKSSII